MPACAQVIVVIDGLYITPKPRGSLTLERTKQPLDVVNRLDYFELFGAEDGNRLFELIKRISDEYKDVSPR